jgi:hypothetical protein
LKQTTNDDTHLLGEDGRPPRRLLRLNDGENRDGKVGSIKGHINAVEQMVDLQRSENKKGWYNLNFGRTFMSKGTKHNLMSALTASKHGLGTYIPIGGRNCYVFDAYGRKFYMVEVNGQLRLNARLYSRDGTYREIVLVHDTGAAATILKADEAVLWEEPGDEVVTMGGFCGERSNLIGGNDLCLMLKAADNVGFINEATEGEPLDKGIMLSDARDLNGRRRTSRA